MDLFKFYKTKISKYQKIEILKKVSKNFPLHHGKFSSNSKFKTIKNKKSDGKEFLCVSLHYSLTLLKTAGWQAVIRLQTYVHMEQIKI